MRSTLTDVELKLWNELRTHRLVGLGFRRQIPIGSQHGNDHRLDYDRARTNRLEQDGLFVLRFWNDDVLSEIVAVCDHILRFIGKSHP